MDDVTRNLVKVSKDKTEGITPRYLDLSEVKKNWALQKGDRIKMEINNHNVVDSLGPCGGECDCNVCARLRSGTGLL